MPICPKNVANFGLFLIELFNRSHPTFLGGWRYGISVCTNQFVNEMSVPNQCVSSESAR